LRFPRLERLEFFDAVCQGVVKLEHWIKISEKIDVRSRLGEFIEAAESLSINDFSVAQKGRANKIGWQAVACQPSKHLTSPLGRNHEVIQDQ
jgi:hypothetical protein